ncbi:MAG: Extracellular ligand-binding receptor [Hyphomicrobiales bacterium]|nr:Extracellular ligand-binding receptor [Hyphomicrobiales bacterium]
MRAVQRAAEAILLSIALNVPTRRVAALVAPALALLLAACGPTGRTQTAAPNLSAPTTPVEAGELAPATPNLEDRPKVALILPLTQAGKPSTVGEALRNAATLAMAETGGADINLIVKDDASTPDGARAATQAALSEGAELIIGPLYAPAVREAGRLAKSAGKPVIGFSTDASTGSRGVFLLSFLIENYVDRVVDQAIARGKKNFAALAPENDYGNVATNALVDLAGKRGLRVQIERYAPGNPASAVQKLGANAAQIDALFIAEQAENMAQVAQLLTASGIDGKRVQILGTGLWNDARVLNLPALQGAWFAAPDGSGYSAFAGRYRAKFGTEPARIATLAYDAVSLSAALARTQGAARFSESVLLNTSGFNGVDGVFRFTPEGLNERGLSVMQIANGAATVLAPAPKTFGGSGT